VYSVVEPGFNVGAVFNWQAVNAAGFPVSSVYVNLRGLLSLVLAGFSEFAKYPIYTISLVGLVSVISA